ncbi:hypothetical protein Cgig2_023799 [Carnegiea gigantea]|uniref:Uncharacterized protein n=1 Tax=Carnegiea gigantea TaxID=171969 RepID=A0A9Q1Q9Z4_9CARY|nr:hypothetical protein Cgig2_023799 [Carnegiea gigantea]
MTPLQPRREFDGSPFCLTICHTRTIGGDAKASVRGSDSRGVQKNEGLEYEPTLVYNPPYQQVRSQCPQKDPSALQGEDVRRIIEAKQALKKAHNSWLATTPYASKSREAGWHVEQEESSRPHYLLNRFLRRRRREDRNCCNLGEKKDNDVERNTKIITTIIRGIDNKELNARYRKA